MRTVNRLMAARCPAGAPGNIGGVVASTDPQPPLNRLLLKVTTQAERLAGGFQHLGIHRAVLCVAGDTALPDGFMLENERALLGGVALQAGAVRIVHQGASPDDGITGMGFVAINAGDRARQDRVCIRQLEFAVLVQVTLETGLR